MNKSFMTGFRRMLFSLVTLCLLASCTKSSDQRQFERESDAIPENFTATDAHGVPVPGRIDPDDWRIGPMFGGLVAVASPAWPNPVTTGSSLRIELDILGIESISGLEVWVFTFPDEPPVGPLFTENGQSLEGGLHTITLSTSQFYNPSTSLTDLYRIKIYDGNQNLITYGDVQIE